MKPIVYLASSLFLFSMCRPTILEPTSQAPATIAQHPDAGRPKPEYKKFYFGTLGCFSWWCTPYCANTGGNCFEVTVTASKELSAVSGSFDYYFGNAGNKEELLEDIATLNPEYEKKVKEGKILFSKAGNFNGSESQVGFIAVDKAYIDTDAMKEHILFVIYTSLN